MILLTFLFCLCVQFKASRIGTLQNNTSSCSSLLSKAGSLLRHICHANAATAAYARQHWASRAPDFAGL